MSGSAIKFGIWKSEEPSFNITRDDLYAPDKTPPVTVFKRDEKESYNRIVVRWTDLSKESGYSYVNANEAVNQRITGIVRKRTYNLDGFINGTLATKMAYRLLAESMYRYKGYKFVLSYCSMCIEVGDVGYLSDGDMIYRELIRITRMTESDSGKEIEIEAIEEKPYLYLTPEQGYAGKLNERFEYPELTSPTVYFSENNLSPYINFHICPQDEDFTGFVIYYSLDGTTYSYAGNCNIVINNCNIDGETVGILPSYTAVIHKKLEEVELSHYADVNVLNSVSMDAFLNNTNLIRIDKEIIAYQIATETGDNTIVSNLIRGLYNTLPTSHGVSEVWHTMKVDFQFKFSADLIGKKLYFKVLTVYGEVMQQLDEVSPVEYTIQGEYIKPVPVSLIRLRDREGFSDFVQSDFIVDFYFGSKISGYNVGSTSGEVWNNFIEDNTIKHLKVLIKNTLEEVLSEITFDLENYPTEIYSLLIEAIDYIGEDEIKIEIIPITSIEAEVRSINVVDRVL